MQPSHRFHTAEVEKRPTQSVAVEQTQTSLAPSPEKECLSVCAFAMLHTYSVGVHNLNPLWLQKTPLRDNWNQLATQANSPEKAQFQVPLLPYPSGLLPSDVVSRSFPGEVRCGSKSLPGDRSSAEENSDRGLSKLIEIGTSVWARVRPRPPSGPQPIDACSLRQSILRVQCYLI